jgi:hypothetical protein
MTTWIHHGVGVGTLILLLGLLKVVFRQFDTRPCLDVLMTLGAAGVLVVVGMVGAVIYGGTNFRMARLAAWTFFLHVPLFFVSTAFLALRRLPVLALVALGVAALVSLVALDAFVIEPHWLEVSRLAVTSPKVEEPVRVVVLADVQTDRPGAYEARVMAQAVAAEPDLVLFAGDYIHLGRRSRGYEAELAALREIVVDAGLSAPLGMYAVRGNVDRASWTGLFDGVGGTAIETTTRHDLGPVVLTGLSMEASFRVDVPVAGEDRFHIVLGHSPNFSLGPVDADLLIAGHTHGGQVQLPLIGPLLTLSHVPRSWASGVTEIALGKTMVVSRGIGMERGAAPRLRFLCRPELVVVDLLPE